MMASNAPQKGPELFVPEVHLSERRPSAVFPANDRPGVQGQLTNFRAMESLIAAAWEVANAEASRPVTAHFARLDDATRSIWAGLEAVDAAGWLGMLSGNEHVDREHVLVLAMLDGFRAMLRPFVIGADAEQSSAEMIYRVLPQWIDGEPWFRAANRLLETNEAWLRHTMKGCEGYRAETDPYEAESDAFCEQECRVYERFMRAPAPSATAALAKAKIALGRNCGQVSEEEMLGIAADLERLAAVEKGACDA